MGRRFCVLAAVAAAALGLAAAASAENYIVLYTGSSVPLSAARTISQAGGMLTWSYDQIGVAIASSSNASFRTNLLARDASVEGVAGTTGFATKLNDTESVGGAPEELPSTPASDADTFSSLQWDMRQINAPQAHAVTGGSPSVLVGDIDTGLDYRHPDLRQNVDDAASVNCLGGVPVQGAAAANDDNGHGTHTAGTIAAAANGTGIVGVAPNVRIAGIKAGNSDGFFFPEAVVCAFVWAGTHHFDVTNNSYFADPYEYNCKNDPVQRAIWTAERRAILFAEQNGVTVVAAEGNDSDDTAHPIQDVTSPDNTTPETRTIHNDCAIVPVEVPGVIGVSAVGSLPQQPSGYLKSFYSNFGVGVTEVTAPGGDSVFRDPAVTPAPGNGRVLSTWPASIPCSRKVQEATGDATYPTAVYCYLQGTSMASPHAAGVAALIVSRYGSLASPQNGKMSPGQVKAYLTQTADPQPCPSALPTQPLDYLGFTGFNSGLVQTCQGGPSSNSWYGSGQVDALNAVTKAGGNG